MEELARGPSAYDRWWRREWPLLALVVLVLGVYFTRLTALPVCGEESRWASAAREMIATGDFVVPRQQGTIFPERPPLGLWAMAMVGSLRGQVDEFAIRLPSALAVLALVLVTYVYARRWASRTAGFTAALALATGGQMMQLGRLGESDALFACFTASALLLWHNGYLDGRNPTRTWCLGYALAALGALVKGPQAPAYFVAATVAYLLLERNWRWLLGRAHVCGLATFAAIIGAWLIPFALVDWQSIDDIWAGLASDRFTLQGLGKHLANYPLETFGCLLPWSPILLALLKPSVARAVWARPSVKFLLVALAVTYPTVWLAAGARGRYYLPLYPCLAILMGLIVDHCTSHVASLADRLMWRRYLRVLAVIIFAGGAVVAIGTLQPEGSLAETAQPRAFLLVWIPAALAAAGLLIWTSLGERRPRPQIALVTLAAFLGVAYAGTMVNVRVRAANDLEPRLAQIKSQIGAGQLVSLGRVYHRFAYSYDESIRQIPWPSSATELPADVTYFCFDRRPGDTSERRSTSDGRLSTTTSGTLPFEWEEVAHIKCDPFQREVHSRQVIIGRVRRNPRIAARTANPPAPRR